MAGNDIERLTFRVESGTLSVLAAGSPSGERILLLHGIPASAELFRDVMPKLAEAGYRIFAPHMPGYGETRLSVDNDYSLSAVADLYAAWLEKEAISPVWLVGHDLGGAVAQIMAVRYPHWITHLSMGDTVVADSFPVFSVRLFMLLAKAGLFPMAASLKLIPNPYASWQLRRAFGDPAKLTKSMLRQVFWDGKVSNVQGRQEFTRHLKHLRNDESVAIAPELKRVSVPTLLLWGELDRYQPADSVGKRLLSLLPEGTAFKVIEGAGHFVPLENPDGYVKTLLEWRQQLEV